MKNRDNIGGTIASILTTLLALALLTYATSRSINFIETTLPPNQKILAYFGVAALVSYCSQAFTLDPGDVIATGTPGGVGIFRTPPVLLADGDEVSVDIERIGRLSNVCRWDSIGVPA